MGSPENGNDVLAKSTVPLVSTKPEPVAASVTALETADNASDTKDLEPEWRQRAVSRSLNAARSRAEKRAQRFIDAAFSLMDEKHTTEFTIQEVIDRSKQSLRGFYQYFDGKEELLLALFEETILEATDDISALVDQQTEPMERLHQFTVRLHEWCEASETKRKRGAHDRRPISEFSVQLAINNPERVRLAMSPLFRMLVELLNDATAAKLVAVANPRHTSMLMMQTIMYSWFGNRLMDGPLSVITAEEAWDFCVYGLRS